MRPTRLGSWSLQGAALCGALLLLLSPQAVHSQSPSPLPPYVHDELSVKFFAPPTETELEIFEVKYRLTHVRELLAPGWHMFHIEDGADAAMKAEWVLEDPSVCAVQLSFLGEWAATTRELDESACQNPEPAPAPESPSHDARNPTERPTSRLPNSETRSSDGSDGDPGSLAGLPIATLAIFGALVGLIALRSLVRHRLARR